MNLDKIITNVTILETLINDVALTNTAKVSQREILFHDALNDVLNGYIAIKDTVNFGDFLNDTFEELYESTEKTTILNVLNVIENSLQVSAIKHDKISYANARDVLELNISDALLKRAINEDAKTYNINLKNIVKLRKFALESEILANNEKLTAHLESKDVDELNEIENTLKIIRKRKIAKAKADKKATK